MGKREIHTSEDLWRVFEEVAKHKKERAAAMRLGVDPTLEKSKDVVAAFARELYERFAADGFKYTPSKHVMKRVVGDWTQEVVYDGHGGNTRGRKIHFKVWAFVKNTPWKRWRKSNSPFWLDETVAVPPLSIEGWQDEAYWDLHENRDRPAIRDEVERLIRAKLFPAFALFTDHVGLRQRMLSEREQHSDRLVMLDSGIDLLMYYFDAAAAAELVDQFARRHGDEKLMADALARARSGWRPHGRSGNEHDVVALAMETYKLPVTHPMLVKLRDAKLVTVDPKAPPSSDGADLLRGQLVDAGFTIAPTPPAPDRETYARNRAAELRREMNDTSLPSGERNAAAHNACEMQEIAGPDEAVWELLAARIKLGLVNRRTALWPSTVELVKRLVARSKPPKEFEHVPEVYLR